MKHAKQDNSKHILEIPLMSAAERYKLLKTAMDDLNVRNSKAGGEEEADPSFDGSRNGNGK